MPAKLPPLDRGLGHRSQYYWVCLRRPANPFARPPDLGCRHNPMVVVDAMRFPYIEGGGTPGTPARRPRHANTIYSAQRFQPYRGGHAVRCPATPTAAAAPLDTRYGYTEQIAVPARRLTGGDQPGAQHGTATLRPTHAHLPHRWATANDQAEPWDYFPFHDRDFTSVAELMLVPGCPPGLFTKQFVELSPMPSTRRHRVSGDHFPRSPPTSRPDALAAPCCHRRPCRNRPTLRSRSTGPPVNAVASPTPSPTWWTSSSTAATAAPVHRRRPRPTRARSATRPGDGWFKMFEFFEVPSQIDRGDRSGRPGDQFRLGPAGHQAGAA